MPKIRDRAFVHWLDNGENVVEELIFYDDSSDSETLAAEEEAEQSIEEEEVEFASDEFVKRLVLQCVNDCFEKFAILKYIAQRKFKPLPVQFPEYKSIEDRFGDKIEYGDEFYSESKKRYMDLVLIYSILYRVLYDLTYKGTFQSLFEGIKILNRLHDEEEQLFYNVKNSVIMERDLKLQLCTQAKVLDTQYKIKLEELHQLELEYENKIGYGKMEVNYMDAWEAARRHQGKLVLNKIETEFIETINTSRMKIDQENKVHDEIIRYFDENIQEMTDEIHYWMEHYDDEVERRDQEIFKSKMERDAQNELLLHLKTIYEVHGEFVEYWGGIKAERKRIADALAEQTNAATRIQRWWRYTMFRRKLGPWKKKKKKGGKDKGKGKKK